MEFKPPLNNKFKTLFHCIITYLHMEYESQQNLYYHDIYA